MKILLVGEYSRLHNSLKEGLQALNHEVTLIAEGDYFKNYPADIKLNRRFQKGILKKFKVAFYKLFKLDIGSLILKQQFFSNAKYLKGYDVVQLINQNPLGIQPKDELEVIEFLRQNNTKLFLMACGTDYVSVNFAYNNPEMTSVLTPFFKDKINEKHYKHVLEKRSKESLRLYTYLKNTCNGIIASDMDYHIPYKNEKKYIGLIPNPVNMDKIKYLPLNTEGLKVIFHGINRANYYKKGNDIFEEALKIIEGQHKDKVKIIRAESMPYNDYIKAYDEAHILLDQIYAYDQGYNALEAMAKGKVVFTGASHEFLNYYNLEEDEVCIHAEADSRAIANKLEDLILNPHNITAISKRARAFIENEHDYIKIAQRYVATWTKN